MKTKILALLLCAVMVMSICACATEGTGSDETTVSELPGQNSGTADETTAPVLTGVWADAIYTENKEFGEGAKTIKVEVVAEDISVTFTINTDAETLGEALTENSLIEGENGAYGLYIKKVNGILADFDVDQTYWSLSKDGEYLMTGADSATIADGEHYELTRTK